MKTITKLWVGIIILTMLSPLGLIMPRLFKSGGAWGEWGLESINKMLGYVPAGMQKLANLWQAPIPDYALRGQEQKGLPALGLSYILSAAIGIIIAVAAVYLLAKFFTKNEK